MSQTYISYKHAYLKVPDRDFILSGDFFGRCVGLRNKVLCGERVDAWLDGKSTMTVVKIKDVVAFVRRVKANFYHVPYYYCSRTITAVSLGIPKLKPGLVSRLQNGINLEPSRY